MYVCIYTYICSYICIYIGYVLRIFFHLSAAVVIWEIEALQEDWHFELKPFLLS